MWLLARKDEENKEIVWCTIDNHEECKKPLRRCGTVPCFWAIRRHFTKYHPEELRAAIAESRKMEETEENLSH